MGANCRKSPATIVKIPASQRRLAETWRDHDCRPTKAVFISESAILFVGTPSAYSRRPFRMLTAVEGQTTRHIYGGNKKGTLIRSGERRVPSQRDWWKLGKNQPGARDAENSDRG